MPYVYIIDDADSRVQYSAGWKTAGSARENNRTTHWTGKNGATATLVFTGTGVAVYGTIASTKQITGGGPPTAFSSIDSGKQVTYSSVPTGKVQYKVQFFSSQSLQNGQHTIVITKSQDCSRFYLDYFVFSFSSPSLSSNVSPTPTLQVTTAVLNTTPAGPNIIPMPTTSPDKNDTSLSQSFLPSNCTPGDMVNPSSIITNASSSTPVSAIVGTLLGCFVLILTAIFIMLLRRHLRDKPNRSSPLDLARMDSQSPAVVPFMMDRTL